MRRCDWLIVFLAADPGGPLDPVRVQKGLFLLAMRAPLDDDERYAFEPYSYGPMSRGLYGDVRRLSSEGLLDGVPIAGAGWRLLALTPAGDKRAMELCLRVGRERPDAFAETCAIRRELDGLSFSELLQRVYDRYPEYAVRSVFRRPR